MEEHAGHTPVLPKQVLELLQPRVGQVMLDCTLGRGGHASLIAPLLGPTGRYIGLDVDPRNLAFARQRLSGMPCHLDLIQANFSQARAVLDRLGVPTVDLLLADLGFSSNQMDDPERGFSFSAAGPLDMRLDPTLPTTAADLVNRLPEKELADLIYRYGEEHFSRRIARKIAQERQRSPILTTVALADVVRRACGHRAAGQRIDPATRTFMALRIAVNGELDALNHLLEDLPRLLAPHARAAIISFHSLEDRRVKQSFQILAQTGQAQKLTKKPLVADDQEISANPRSRSAKLRSIRTEPGGTRSGIQ